MEAPPAAHMKAPTTAAQPQAGVQMSIMNPSVGKTTQQNEPCEHQKKAMRLRGGGAARTVVWACSDASSASSVVRYDYVSNAIEGQAISSMLHRAVVIVSRILSAALARCAAKAGRRVVHQEREP
ncbi:hypothetical protein BDZ89DRAFT_1112643 [Hymenopellis radicata]|nr:hypothetical protein BDZ89DRAFT_1112643 [Hymenopellis radicata]